MELVDVFFYLTLVVLLLLGFAAGANDAATSVATVIGANALRIRVALIVAGIAAALAALLFAAPIYADYAARLMPISGDLAEPNRIIYGIFSGLLATTVTMFALTLMGMPVAPVLALAGALLGIGIVAAGAGAVDWGLFVVVVLVAWLAPVVTLGIGFGLFALVRNRIVSYWRPRDRMRTFMPLSVGLMAALAVLLVPAAFNVGAGLAGMPWWGLAILALIAFAVGFGASWGAIRARPFWISNDQEGAEAGYRRLAIAGSFILAFTFGAYQTLNAAAPALVMIGLGRGALPLEQLAEGPVAVDPGFVTQLLYLLPVAVGLLAGVILLGHRTCRTVGDKLVGLTNTRAFTVNLSTALAALMLALFGLPVLASHAATGAVVGVGLRDPAGRPRTATMVRLGLAWLLTAPAAAVLGMAFYGILAAVIG